MRSITPLDLVRLGPLMQRTSGSPAVAVGLIDGPVARDHPDLAGQRIVEIRENGGRCSQTSSIACLHGTFVAGILSSKRGSAAPAICPGCTLLTRPIFSEGSANAEMPRATAEGLAEAILDCIAAGARVLNVSAALTGHSHTSDGVLKEALHRAAQRGVIVVAATGNQRTIGSTAMTENAQVLPVVAYDQRGKPMDQSNLGGSIGRRGLGGPGDRVISAGANGRPLALRGTSAAAPFVTGAIALLWSEFPSATASEIRKAITQGRAARRTTVIPPLLDAWRAYQVLRG